MPEQYMDNLLAAIDVMTASINKVEDYNLKLELSVNLQVLGEAVTELLDALLKEKEPEFSLLAQQ